MRLIVINQTFALTLSIPARTHSVLSLPVELLSVHSRPEPLRAQRSGEQASGTRRLASRHLLGCCGQSGFWGASSATAHRRDRLLPLRRVFFLVDVRADRDRLLRLLPGGRSRDCTANIFLHRLWSATSSNALCRLVRMEPPVPSALVPPLGTILNDCFSFSVCLLLLQ